MSTSFEVYPRRMELPTFSAIIDRSTMELHRFLDSIGIRKRPRVHVRLQACADDAHVPFSLKDSARWNKETYAWFMVGDVPGGTDAYFDDDADEILQYWDGELGNPNCRKLESLVRECVRTGHRWCFRRSAGQPGIISLAYGLIAGSLAAITDGIVYSEDSAWDWQRMPALPLDFLSWYFRPEQAIAAEFREWSSRCLDLLVEELGESADVQPK
jgi:hypothetical protein